MNSQSSHFTNALKEIRKEYKVHARNRGGKLYLKVYWDNGSLHEYNRASLLIEKYFPDAYVTSASTFSDATFRVNGKL